MATIVTIMDRDGFLGVLDSKGDKYKFLADLIRRNKQINLKFFAEEGFVCVCCHIDRKLIEWAATPFKFPRGFVVDLAAPDPKFRGFLPKFSNDARDQHIVEGEYEDYVKAVLTPKISGFLINIIVTKGKFRLVNKNSYGTEFTVKATQIFEEWTSANTDKAATLLIRCERGGLTLSAEFMHTEDKMHGYVAKRNCFAVTCISSSEDAGNAALRYFTFEEKDAFCSEFNLPFLPSWIVGGGGGGDVSGFMAEFNRVRDNMTYSSFEALMVTKANMLNPGNFDHVANLGDTLEGTIAFCEKADGDEETKKVKLIQYTGCTMVFRQNVGNPLNKSLIRKVRKGTKAWTVSDAGYHRWLGITLRAFDLAGRVPDSEAYIDAGLHAATWEKAIAAGPLGEDEFRAKHGIGTKPQLPLVAIVGPVGYGKSSLGNAVAKTVSAGIHIDGDKLDLDSEAEVLRLGKERTPYTLYKVAEAWMGGRTPVLSTGGGVLDNVEGAATDFFPDHELNLVVIVPDNFRHTYDAWKVDDVVTRRIAAGTWTLPSGQKLDKFITKIQKLSVANVKFADKLSEIADKTFTYTALTPETAAIYNTFPILDYMSTIKRDIPEVISYKQYRVLATCPQVPKYGHVTLEFVPDAPDGKDEATGGAGGDGGGDGGRKKVVRHLVFKDDKDMHAELDATILTVKAKKGCQMVTIPNNELLHIFDEHGNVKTHMTVNAGPHAPVKMGDITAAFLLGETEVTVDDITYDLSRAKQVKTKLKLRGVFCL